MFYIIVDFVPIRQNDGIGSIKPCYFDRKRMFFFMDSISNHLSIIYKAVVMVLLNNASEKSLPHLC